MQNKDMFRYTTQTELDGLEVFHKILVFPYFSYQLLSLLTYMARILGDTFVPWVHLDNMSYGATVGASAANSNLIEFKK